jgi:hypothetical protein
MPKDDQADLAARYERVKESLQELVAKYGGYDKVTKEGWAEYDAAMAEYIQIAASRRLTMDRSLLWAALIGAAAMAFLVLLAFSVLFGTQ